MVQPVSTLYPDWPQYDARLRAAVRELTAEQLAIRAGPDHDPIWVLAAHVAGSRAYWLCGVLGEPGAERTPFTEPATGIGWEDVPEHPRSGDELDRALESTFAVVRDCLGRWTVDDLAHATERTFGGVTVTHTRGSVLNRLLSHDAFHAGEISQLLGLHSLPEIDLWRRAAPRATSP